MNFAHCPTPDNDTEGEEVQDEDTEQADPFLTLSGTEEQYSLSRSINFSRPRGHNYQPHDTIKSRHNIDGRASLLKRQSDTAHSEATDITWATATSQDNPGTPDYDDPNSRTITVDTRSHQPADTYIDQSSNPESLRDRRVIDAVYQGKTESPVPPAEGSSSSLNVWDELDAIKRRLRQLESTHSPERPHSRGTATSSSSPQRSSPFPSQAGTSMSSTTSSTTYPLLNAAITKVKASGLSTEITQAIEATAQEAVSLTSITTHEQSPSPRSLRKKVDGVCRGLAEVCLALADHQQQSQRYQSRAAQHRAEDAQDSSPLSASGRQSLTLSRVTSKRLSSNGGALSRIDTTLNRPRRPALSTVGDDEDDMMSTVSRPGISRYSTIQYRPSSRAGTEIFRDTTNAAISNLQRFTTTRRLFSRHGPSMSDHQIRATVDHETASEVPPMPLTAVRSTFDRSTIGPSTNDNRRRSLNLQSYFNSPPRITQVEASKLPTPPRRPISLISPPRVNVAHRNPDSEERRDGTVRRRPAASVVGDIMDDGRSTIGRASGNSNRRSLGGGDVRRQVSVTRGRFGNRNTGE